MWQGASASGMVDKEKEAQEPEPLSEVPREGVPEEEVRGGRVPG